MIKKWILALASLLIMFCPMKVMANEKGSITLYLTDTVDQRSKENVMFEWVQVGTWDDGKLVLKEEFSATDLDLNTLDTAVDLKEAAEKLMEVGIEDKQQLKTNEQGIASVEGLDEGCYLVYPVNLADYEQIDPTLVSIPYYDDEQKMMNHTITIFCKHAPWPVLEIHKVDAQTKQVIKKKPFAFEAYKDSSQNEVFSKSVDIKGEGKVSFVLDEETLYIKETSAPKGYRLSDEMIKVTYDGKAIYINGQKQEHKEGQPIIYTWENAKIPVVKTSVDFPLMTWIVVGAFALSGLIVLIIIKKNQKS